MLKFNKQNPLPYVPAHVIGLYQEGGQMQMSEEMPQDPMMEIASMAQQAVETNDGQLALQVCQVILQMLQQEEAPMEEMPMETAQ